MALIKCVAAKCKHNRRYECHCCQIDINSKGHCTDYEPIKIIKPPKSRLPNT